MLVGDDRRIPVTRFQRPANRQQHRARLGQLLGQRRNASVFRLIAQCLGEIQIRLRPIGEHDEIGIVLPKWTPRHPASRSPIQSRQRDRQPPPHDPLILIRVRTSLPRVPCPEGFSVACRESPKIRL